MPFDLRERLTTGGLKLFSLVGAIKDQILLRDRPVTGQCRGGRGSCSHTGRVEAVFDKVKTVFSMPKHLPRRFRISRFRYRPGPFQKCFGPGKNGFLLTIFLLRFAESMNPVSVANIVDYLLDRYRYRDLQRRSILAEDLVDGQVVCLLADYRRDPVRQRKGESAMEHRFMKEFRKICRSATICIWSSKDDRQAGVSLSSFKDGWAFRPFWQPIDLNKGLIVPLTCPSVEVLCRLILINVQRLNKFPSSIGSIREECEGHIVSLIKWFGEEASPGYFLSKNSRTAWIIASQWGIWEKNHSSTTERLELLRGQGVNIDHLELLALHPASTAITLRRSSKLPKLPNQSSLLQEPVNPPTITCDQAQKTVSSESDPPFSWQTKYKTIKTLDPLIAKDLRCSGIWWWRDLFSNASRADKELFVIRHERSAYFYELRARLHAKGNLPTYPYLLPWCELDVTRRRILAALWPPNLATEAQKPIEVWYNLSERVIFKQKVDFCQPLPDLLEEVTRRWKELEPRLRALWPMPIVSFKTNQRKVLKELNLGISHKWKLLETLDLKQAGLVSALTRSQKKVLKKQKELYFTACLNAGIPT